MYGITQTLKYGEYQFYIGFDSGSETGLNQLLVDAAEKIDVDSVPLSTFSLEELLQALREPDHTRLRERLEAQKRAQVQPLDIAIAELERPLHEPGGKGRFLPHKERKQVKELRRQKREALQQLEGRFLRQEVLLLDAERFDRSILCQHTKRYGESRHLRDFYFEEANDQYIHNFCRKFALDADYRQEVLEGRAPWVERNKLFVRNLPALMRNLPGINLTRAQQIENDRKVREFFKWVCAHAQAIFALPEYQRIQVLDNAFEPTRDELDPGIKPAVEALNQIPGVVTRFSCQGVSGKVHFEGVDLLTVSHHQEFAYVSFQTFEAPAQQAFHALLPNFPSVRLLEDYSSQWHLRSTGDNPRFREEAMALAQRAPECISVG